MRTAWESSESNWYCESISDPVYILYTGLSIDAQTWNTHTKNQSPNPSYRI